MSPKVHYLNCKMGSGFRVQVAGLVFCFEVGISHGDLSVDLHSKT